MNMQTESSANLQEFALAAAGAFIATAVAIKLGPALIRVTARNLLTKYAAEAAGILISGLLAEQLAERMQEQD